MRTEQSLLRLTTTSKELNTQVAKALQRIQELNPTIVSPEWCIAIPGLNSSVKEVDGTDFEKVYTVLISRVETLNQVKELLKLSDRWANLAALVNADLISPAAEDKIKWVTYNHVLSNFVQMGAITRFYGQPEKGYYSLEVGLYIVLWEILKQSCLLKEKNELSDHAVLFGRLKYTPRGQAYVEFGSKRVALSRQESLVLSFLWKKYSNNNGFKSNSIATKEQLNELLGSDPEADNHITRVLISTLNKKLNPHSIYIENMSRVGYYLTFTDFK